jgi:hypothetical protein
LKISIQFVLFLFAALFGLIVGEYFDPTGGKLLHWDQFIDYNITKYVYMAGVLIEGLVLTAFVLIPVKLYRYPIWVAVLIAYVSRFVVSMIEVIRWYDFSVIYTFQSFFFDIIPFTIGVFSVVGLWYFIFVNFLSRKSNSE